MEEFIRFLLGFEAGLATSGMSQVPNVTVFALAKKSGFSNHPADPGGATMCGVTLSTYRGYCKGKGYPVPSVNDLKDIPYAHWRDIFLMNFWNYVSASRMDTISHAWLIVDWVWASGPKVLKRVQRLLNVKADGIFGPQTLSALNGSEARLLFDLIHQDRVAYVDELCRIKPEREVFRKGWLRRINSITFDKLIDNDLA